MWNTRYEGEEVFVGPEFLWLGSVSGDEAFGVLGRMRAHGREFFFDKICNIHLLYLRKRGRVVAHAVMVMCGGLLARGEYGLYVCGEFAGNGHAIHHDFRVSPRVFSA